MATLGSLALVGGVMAALAAPADAAITSKPRTYTAVMTPTTAVPGQSTSYAVVVKNTSTVISALDHFVLTAPAGFTVVPGAVSSPRGGWTETFGNGDLTAKTTQPLKYALRKGESMTVRFSATGPVTCTGSTVTWAPKADGIIIDPFVFVGSAPQVQMTPVANNFHVTAVTDGSNPPLDHQVVVTKPFTVSGEFRCGTTPAPVGSSGTTVTLSKSSGSGSLGGTTSTNVAVGDSSATVSGATLDTVQNGVGISVDWSGSAAVDDSFTIDVLGDAATSDGAPGSTLTVDGAQAVLSQGANGPVSLVVESCAGDQTGGTAPCSNGTQVELTGNFKSGTGDPLYSNTTPAEIDWLCSAAACPHGPNQTTEGGEPSGDYTYNYFCPNNNCQGEGSLFGEREVEEDFNWYPVYISIFKDGTQQPFVRAGRCVTLPSSSSDPDKVAKLTATGQITDPAAQTAGFCVDVNAITRTGNSFTGDLKIPVLFVEDLKLRP